MELRAGTKADAARTVMDFVLMSVPSCQHEVQLTTSSMST